MRRPSPALPPTLPPAHQAGFTLIEMIVALALFALISLAGLALLQSVLGVQRRTEGRLDRLADLQRAMYVVDADFAQIAGPPLAQPAAIAFRRHGVDGTALIRYAFAGGRLERAVDGRGRVLLDGIDGAGLRYHLPDGAWTVTPPDIAHGLVPDAIEVTLRLRPAPGLPGGTLRRIIPLPAA